MWPFAKKPGANVISNGNVEAPKKAALSPDEAKQATQAKQAQSMLIAAIDAVHREEVGPDDKVKQSVLNKFFNSWISNNNSVPGGVVKNGEHWKITDSNQLPAFLRGVLTEKNIGSYGIPSEPTVGPDPMLYLEGRFELGNKSPAPKGSRIDVGETFTTKRTRVLLRTYGVDCVDWSKMHPSRPPHDAGKANASVSIPTREAPIVTKANTNPKQKSYRLS